MEEDIGVKAPVTRLRRRLSVEKSDDVKSPSAPSTPTKKRGGRLAVKPQLDLIEENAPVSSQKRTTRKVSRDIAEPAEDKPVTPSRRNTRIKSNTSIVSETTQSFDSPRARRATRRNSQVDSDSEASVTPARQTRKTRRDSASNIESQAEVAPVTKSTKQITEDVIIEEPEFDLQKTTNDADISLNATDEEISPKNTRKSLRLMEKKARKSTSPKSDNDVLKNQNKGTNVNKSSGSEKSTPEKTITSRETLTALSNSKENNLSVSTLNLIKDLDTEPIRKTNNLNKTTSAMENSSNFLNKRHRTKSWTTIAITQSTNSDFYSDNETKKNKIMENDNNNLDLKQFLNKVGSGDYQNTSKSLDKTISMQEEKVNTQINSSSKKKKRHSENYVEQSSGKEILTPNKSKNIDISIEMPKTEDQSIIKKKMEKIDIYKNSKAIITAAQLFAEPPSSIIKTMVFIEDSDSNTDITEKTNKIIDENDQCVPVVEHQFENHEKVSLNKVEQNINLDERVHHSICLNDTYETIRKLSSGYNSITKQTSNDSCEPMDIDVTIPDNTSLTNIQNDFNKLQSEELEYERKPKSSECISEEIKDKSINKSKRKSTPHSISQDLEKIENENKSTLILSQIKDSSSTEDNVSKSSKNYNDEYLSKSTKVPNTIKDKNDKKNLSLNETAHTPLKQKNIKKLGIQTSTPVVACNDENKEIIDDNHKSESIVSVISKTSENSSSEEESDESSKEKNDFIDEAEDASYDYESGDSLDEDEIEYERQNEILHKGETLSSNSDFSNDSEYERDSFVVSSDCEDMDLLSGTGDDLSMSNNELTMSAKSKKKYNERKIKEQKNASREMYGARHNLNISDKSSNVGTPKRKKNRRRLDSSAFECDNNLANNSKVSDYEKLNSSHEIDSVKSNLDETLSKKKKKKNHLSHSFTEEVLDEKEITAPGDKSTLEKEDPLSGSIKLEPKTPQKNLNISTVNFVIKDEVEHIHLDENTTISKTNESVDPLLATMVEHEKSLSENEEIKQSYDSLLKELNKNKKIKTHDISLNVNKKPKKTANESIIDQLNLTQTKTTSEKGSDKTITKEKYVNVDEDTSSDAIDLKILFSDNSNSSVENDNLNKQRKKKVETIEDFIPLKRTKGKTNIRESMETWNDSKDVSLLNESYKGNNVKSSRQSEKADMKTRTKEKNSSMIKTPNSGKKKSSEILKIGQEGNECDNTETLFVDTIGKLNDSVNKSHKKSKKKKDNNVSITCELEPNEDSNECDNTEVLLIDTTEKLNESINRSYKKSKKKKDNDMSVTCEPKPNEGNECNNTEALFVDTTEKLNECVNRSHKKEKKKKDNNISITCEPEPSIENANELDTTEKLNGSVNRSHKKSKKKKDNNMSITCEPEPNNENLTAEDRAGNTLIKTPSSGRKKSLEHSITEHADNERENKETLFDDTPEKINESVNKSHKKSKKKKENNMSVTCEPVSNNENAKETVSNSSLIMTPGSTKKKTSEPLNIEQSKNITATEKSLESTKKDIISETSKHNSLQNKKEENVPEVIIADNNSLDNRKRKFSANLTPENFPLKDARIDKKNIQEVFSKQEAIYSGNKNRHLQNQENIQITSNEPENMKKNKKRKNRDDADGTKKSKAFKETISSKVHIPRLPDAVLNQLEEKPKNKMLKIKKPKIISTSNFIIEKTKIMKNKPSNYLEESVYLNDSPVLKKQKEHIKKPKVLPFIPTASTSINGFTTNFKINVIPQETQFVAQSSNTVNFKNEHLYKSIKKLGTYELYKRHRNIKMSKF